MNPPRATATSALRIRPMKTAFVAVTATAIRCRQYVEEPGGRQVFAVATWKWRMLNSLAILRWLRAILRKRVSRRADSSVCREFKGDEDGVALRNGGHRARNAFLMHFGVLEKGLGPGESVLGP